MKKLILSIIVSSFLLSCSSNSSSDSNNPSSTGLLLKTRTLDTNVVTFSYNGNKMTGYINSIDGSYGTATYNGDFVSQVADFSPNNKSEVTNYTYINNLLSTKNFNTNYNNPPYTENSTFTHNLDGSVTENITKTTSTGVVVSQNKYIYYYTSGNVTKKEEFNSAMTLTYTTTFTYDNKNSLYKNVTGLLFLNGLDGFPCTHNETGFVKTNNVSGTIAATEQITYIYNSQDYPISLTNTTTSYNFDPLTGTNTPSTPQTYSETFTYN